jgi:hypothetical protein
MRGCTSRSSLLVSSLLREELRRAGYESRNRRDLAKEVASSVDCHGISPSGLSVEESKPDDEPS